MEDRERTRELSLDILRDLGGRPAVAFHEGLVAEGVRARLAALGLTATADAYGNLVARLPGAADAGVPPIAFVAHMDHPGFEAVEVSRGGVTARALGGVPQVSLTSEVLVQLVLPDGSRVSGGTAGPTGHESGQMVSVRVSDTSALEMPLPVVFDLADFEMDGDLILMRALDDLAGCAAALAALSLLSGRSGLGDVYGVFTRAEEVGLVGARLLAEAGTLPRDTLVVSLEASRTLPGAAIGGGPVIRVGDASLTFDADAEAVLVAAREELMDVAPGFEAQRQLMSGGTCEASAFRYHGYRTTGVAFPLGNYHNGTPLGGVAEEYIHVDDFVGGVELIVRAAQCVSRRLECRPWRRMADLSQEHRRRLEAGWGAAGPAT
ncbi:MAG: M20/M25/M40 family metallo-hydrolase [Dehalococcoidia bacterium]|nr:M20/M25/M40 family metallo-hydrolase [Dehalococcoidia bacterium]